MFSVILTKFLSFNTSHGVYICYLYIRGNNNQCFLITTYYYFFYYGYNNVEHIYNVIEDLLDIYLEVNVSDSESINDIYIELKIITIYTFEQING